MSNALSRGHLQHEEPARHIKCPAGAFVCRAIRVHHLEAKQLENGAPLSFPAVCPHALMMELRQYSPIGGRLEVFNDDYVPPCDASRMLQQRYGRVRSVMQYVVEQHQVLRAIRMRQRCTIKDCAASTAAVTALGHIYAIPMQEIPMWLLNGHAGMLSQRALASSDIKNRYLLRRITPHTLKPFVEGTVALLWGLMIVLDLKRTFISDTFGGSRPRRADRALCS